MANINSPQFIKSAIDNRIRNWKVTGVEVTARENSVTFEFPSGAGVMLISGVNDFDTAENMLKLYKTGVERGKELGKREEKEYQIRYEAWLDNLKSGGK